MPNGWHLLSVCFEVRVASPASGLPTGAGSAITPAAVGIPRRSRRRRLRQKTPERQFQHQDRAMATKKSECILQSSKLLLAESRHSAASKTSKSRPVGAMEKPAVSTCSWKGTRLFVSVFLRLKLGGCPHRLPGDCSSSFFMGSPDLGVGEFPKAMTFQRGFALTRAFISYLSRRQ